MKSLSLFTLLLLMFGCQSKYVRKLNRIQGTWHLQKVTYFNNGFQSFSDNLGTIHFSETTPPNSLKGSYKGTQTINDKSYAFDYSFDFSGGKVDIAIPKAIRDQLPLQAVGKVQVYQFSLVNDNLLTLEVANELYEPTKEVLKNVTYTLVR